MRNAMVPALAALGLISASVPGNGAEEKPEQRREWLIVHQSPDGSWDPTGFDAQCTLSPRCQGKGRPEDRVGTTSLFLLAILRYGIEPDKPVYGPACRRGLDYLVSVQDEGGSFVRRDARRAGINHAQATLTMVEAIATFREAKYRESARKGLRYFAKLRVAGQGWGIAEGAKETDLTTSTWAVLALAKARSPALEPAGQEFPEVLAWLDTCTDPATGRVGPPRTSGPEPETAMAACIRSLAGPGLGKDPLLKKGIDVLLASRPEWDEEGRKVDLVYWWFGTLACGRVGGDAWKRWNQSMKKAIIESQHVNRAECRWGSWDALGHSSAEGRPGATAYGVLCLIEYYRYAK